MPPSDDESNLPEGVLRNNVPFVGDVVTVSSPSILRKLVEHPDIARPDQGKLPTAVYWMLHATQFFAPSHGGGEYAVAFTTTSCNDQAARRRRVFDNLSKQFTEDQVGRLAKIVNSDMEKEEAAKLITSLVGPTVLGMPDGEIIPDKILDYMNEMDLQYLLNPIQYFKALRAREKVQEWVTERFPEEEHVVDIAHDLVTVYHGFTAGLLGLRRMEGDDLSAHLGRNPILPVSLRVPRVTTTVDGIFPEDGPLIEDKTLIVLDNGSAAQQTLDPSFVFGMGSEKRQCPFRNVFFSTSEKILAKNKLASRDE